MIYSVIASYKHESIMQTSLELQQNFTMKDNFIYKFEIYSRGSIKPKKN